MQTKDDQRAGPQVPARRFFSSFLLEEDLVHHSIYLSSRGARGGKARLG